jgi:hypothetical protein
MSHLVELVHNLRQYQKPAEPLHPSAYLKSNLSHAQFVTYLAMYQGSVNNPLSRGGNEQNENIQNCVSRDSLPYQDTCLFNCP